MDVEQLVRFSVNSNKPEAGLIARRQDSDNDTFYGVEVGTTRFDDLEIFKLVDGNYVRLFGGGDGSQVSSSSNYWMRFKVTSNGGGTDLQVRIWQDGTPEPAAWTAEVLGDLEPKLQNASGRFGTWSDQGGIGRLITYDDYFADYVP